MEKKPEKGRVLKNFRYSGLWEGKIRDMKEERDPYRHLEEEHSEQNLKKFTSLEEEPVKHINCAINES